MTTTRDMPLEDSEDPFDPENELGEEVQGIGDDFPNLCLTEPCPCGSFYVPNQYGSKSKKNNHIVLEPDPEIDVYAHSPSGLIICTLKPLSEVKEALDRRWGYKSSRPCMDIDCARPQGAVHYEFNLVPEKKKGQFTLRIPTGTVRESQKE